jgi:predicted aconitase with swiveling domain
MKRILQGQEVIAGTVRGLILHSSEPLSFWGGYDYRTGEIIDRRHPLAGRMAGGTVLCLPHTRGSSTTTAVLLEAIKARTAPAAIVTTGVDTFFALASIVADELYALPIPLVALSAEDFDSLQTASVAELAEGGRIILSY